MIHETTYVTYLAISIVLTIWVAQTLSANGRAFLVRAFRGDDELADSINHMLVVGFYLVNLGYVFLSMSSQYELTSIRDALEFLSQRLGFVLLALGVMHFINTYIVTKHGRTIADELGGDITPATPES